MTVEIGSRQRARRVFWIAAWLLCGTLACLGRSPEVRYFTLGADALAPLGARAPELAVLVGPARLPSYLERPQLARRLAGGEIRLDEFHRWLGGFESNFLEAVAGALREQLGSIRIVAHPSRPPFALDRRIRIHVDEMVAEDDRRFLVRVRWAVERPGDATAEPELRLLEREYTLTSGSSEALVGAYGRAARDLAGAIADRLAATPVAPPAPSPGTP